MDDARIELRGEFSNDTHHVNLPVTLLLLNHEISHLGPVSTHKPTCKGEAQHDAQKPTQVITLGHAFPQGIFSVLLSEDVRSRFPLNIAWNSSNVTVPSTGVHLPSCGLCRAHKKAATSLDTLHSNWWVTSRADIDNWLNP